jgi:DNA-binding response OmpR family regulator
MTKSTDAARVLIVDDQASIRKLIGAYLRANGFEVFEASSLEVARRVCDIWKPSIVLLDILLDNENGLDFLQERHGSAKVIVFSTCSGISDRITALEMGAFDYLSKAVDLREMYLKIRKLDEAHRSTNVASLEERFGDLTLNVLTRDVIGPLRSVRFSKTEILLLRLLVSESEKLFTREYISRVILARCFPEGNRSVDVMVSKVRTKLTTVGSNLRLMNIRERGYKMVIHS